VLDGAGDTVGWLGAVTAEPPQAEQVRIRRTNPLEKAAGRTPQLVVLTGFIGVRERRLSA
jgi:hypothetical protein